MKIRIEFEDGDESNYDVLEFSRIIDDYDELSRVVSNLIDATNWRAASVLLASLELELNCGECSIDEILAKLVDGPQGVQESRAALDAIEARITDVAEIERRAAKIERRAAKANSDNKTDVDENNGGR